VQPGKVSDIELIGRKNESGILSVKAHLAPSDAVPLIIGFKNLLDQIPLHTDYQRGEAFIELGAVLRADTQRDYRSLDF